jgi:hypothetical protein
MIRHSLESAVTVYRVRISVAISLLSLGLARAALRIALHAFLDCLMTNVSAMILVNTEML